MSAKVIVEKYYAAFNAGDIETMAALCAQDVAHDVNQGGRRIGREAFLEFSGHMSRCYRERLRDIVVMADESGTRAAAEFIVDGEYLATDGDLPEARGQKYSLLAGAFLALEDGVITRVTTYYNLPEWTRQVKAV